MATPQVAVRARQYWGEFWLAITFLTTIPAPPFIAPSTGLGVAGRWFPVVGLIVGVALWLVHTLADYFFPAALTGALVVLAWVALTGGLHLDGVADCGDGLLATTSRERRLEIMRDPRVGSFGAICLLIVLLLKTIAIGFVAPVALVVAPIWARWMLLFAARQPQARPDGMGAHFAAGITPETLVVASALPVIILLIAADARGFVGAVLAVAAMLAVVRLAKVRIGGVTGDVYGLVVEASEVVMLLAFAAQPG